MKKFLLFVFILLLVGGGFAYYGYQLIFGTTVNIGNEEAEIYIPTGSDFSDVLDTLTSKEIISNPSFFAKLSQYMKYDDNNVAPGKYTIKANGNAKDLITLLRSGKQTPVKVTFNNVRKIEDLAGKISSYLEVDSLTMWNYFQSEKALSEANTNIENLITIFIPNTYEAYWTETPEKFLQRMIRENEKFWKQKDRLSKAEELGMTKEEVYTMASIVEKESIRNDEKPRIAGVYLNRIKQGMKLDADPTVVFAIGNFELKRILYKHLEYDSPYNTYKNAGLPPGPIYMPSIRSIDAVLDHEDHKYLYFCAKPESNGGHLFAETISQHNANARVYHRWLDKQGIR